MRGGYAQGPQGLRAVSTTSAVAVARAFEFGFEFGLSKMTGR